MQSAHAKQLLPKTLIKVVLQTVEVNTKEKKKRKENWIILSFFMSVWNSSYTCGFFTICTNIRKADGTCKSSLD